MKKRRLPVNDENTLLVVTSFPPTSTEKKLQRDEAHAVTAVSLHAKKTLTKLSEKQTIVVLAEQFGKKKTHIENRRLTVYRVWQRKNPLSLLKILPYVVKYVNIQNILFQFDFDVFGGLRPTFLLPFIIGLMKFLGKHVYFEFQHVPDNALILKRHSLKMSKIKIQSTKPYIKKIETRLQQFQIFIHQTWISLMNLYLRSFYTIIGWQCDKIIVPEEDMRDRLSEYISNAKLVVLPVGVTEQKTMSKARAKRALGFSSRDFVVLVFGFFDWHKGTDWIAKVFEQTTMKNMRLLLVGGRNPALKPNKNYKLFYKDLAKTAQESSRTKIVGFVPDEKIVKYYSASDVVALPYREFIAAPTTLNHALSFHKPVIFSTKFLEYMKSPDFLSAMETTGLTDQDIFFSIDKNDVVDILKNLRADKKKYKQLTSFSKTLAKQRRASKLTRDYHTIVSKSYVLTPRFAFSSK